MILCRGDDYLKNADLLGLSFSVWVFEFFFCIAQSDISREVTLYRMDYDV